MWGRIPWRAVGKLFAAGGLWCCGVCSLSLLLSCNLPGDMRGLVGIWSVRFVELIEVVKIFWFHLSWHSTLQEYRFRSWQPWPMQNCHGSKTEKPQKVLQCTDWSLPKHPECYKKSLALQVCNFLHSMQQKRLGHTLLSRWDKSWMLLQEWVSFMRTASWFSACISKRFRIFRLT